MGGINKSQCPIDLAAAQAIGQLPLSKDKQQAVHNVNHGYAELEHTEANSDGNRLTKGYATARTANISYENVNNDETAQTQGCGQVITVNISSDNALVINKGRSTQWGVEWRLKGMIGNR